MRFPVFLVALSFAAGLAAFYQVDDSPPVLLGLTVISLATGALFLRKDYSRSALACALTGFFLLGGATIRLEEVAIPLSRIDRLAAAGKLNLTEAVRVRGWLRRDPSRLHGLTRLTLELEQVEQGGKTFEASGGVRVSFNPVGDDAFGDRLPPLRYGDRMELLLRLRPLVQYQNRGSFSWQAYWNRQEIYFDGTLRSVLLLERLPDQRGNAFFGATQQLRSFLLQRLDALAPEGEPRDVLHAMLLGDRAALGDELKEKFRLSGGYHVLVISGLHVGLIALFIFWLLGRLRCSEGFASLVTITVLVVYLLIVEDRPPTERAVWMVSLYLLSRLFFRKVHLANPAGLAALLLLFIHPTWLFDPSFHFTFGAVFLLAFLGVPWMESFAEPWLAATKSLEAEHRDDQQTEPRLAQFRLDLRLLAEFLSPWMFWTAEKEQAARRLVVGAARLGLQAWKYFLLSFAIHLGFLVLIPYTFQQMIWTGLLANILLVPLVGVIVPFGLATLILPWVGDFLAPVLVLLVEGLIALVEAFSSLPLNYRVPPPPLWLLFLYLVCLAALALAVNLRWRQRWFLFALVPLWLLISLHPFPPLITSGEFSVTVLDVGQGDALFLSFPDGDTWLLDGGGGPREIPPGEDSAEDTPPLRVGHETGSSVVGAYLRSARIKRLDNIWLSHPHQDHMAGLEPVLEEFTVGSVHVGWPANTPARNVALLGWAAEHRVPVRTHTAGEKFFSGDVQVEVLWPAADYTPQEDKLNNDSLVLRLCRFEHCLLLPGDIEQDVEKLLARNPSVAATLLKVPHHGGRHAATKEFLAAVRPALAIISVGARNPHGHPRPDTLARLETAGAQVFRTDRDGSVTLRITREGISVRTFRQGQPARPYPNLAAKLVHCLQPLGRLE